MAIYGVGAYHGNDVSEAFIREGLVGVGWGINEAPELSEFFKSLKVGDIVYIKAAHRNPNIIVKGIGIIIDNIIREAANSNDLVTTGRNVIWINTERFIIPKPTERNNVRSNTIYEEFHPEVQQEIIRRIREST